VGEAAGWAVVSAHCRPTAGTANFIIPGLGNFPHDFIVDSPVKEVLFVYELYVNFFLADWNCSSVTILFIIS